MINYDYEDVIANNDVNTMKEYLDDHTVTIGYCNLHGMERTDDESCYSVLADYLRLLTIECLADNDIDEAVALMQKLCEYKTRSTE